MTIEDVVTTQGVPEPGRRMSRWQLMVIGTVVALAAGIGVVLGLTVFSPRPGAAGPAASYLPADTVVYGEVHLELSAGQAASLRAVLDRFPAADSDLIPLDAIGEAIDQPLTTAGSPITYAADVAPWFDGHVSIALLDYQLANATIGNVPTMAALFGVKDAAAAEAFAGKLRDAAAQAGAAVGSSPYRGVTIWSVDDDAFTGDGGNADFAVTGDQFIVATGVPNGLKAIQQMLDAHAGSDNLGAREELAQLVSHLPADWVGFFAIDTRQLVQQVRAAAEQSDPAVSALLDQYIAAVPPFAVSTFGLEDDAVVVHAAASLPGGDLVPANSQRDLAARVPADTLFFADGNRVGAGLAQFITTLRATITAQPGGEEAKPMLEQAEAALGGDLQDFVSWIGSGAVAVGAEAGTPYGGLVLTADDVDTARQRLGQLRALVDLGAGQSGQQVRFTTDIVEGVEVTTITAQTGMSGDILPVVPEVVVQYAIKDDTVLIGFGDSFVGRSLRLGDGESLADSNRFLAAIGRFGGGDNAGVAFVDLSGIREAVEQAAGQMLPPEYAQQIKPNLVPLDYLVNVTRVEGDVVVSRGGVVLR